MTNSVTSLISAHAQPLSTDDDAPLDDVHDAAASLACATVVALGHSARTTHELSVVAARFVRALVAEYGFRSFALEGDEPASAELDAYLRTGRGDPVDLLRRARAFWRTREILSVIRWLRAYNVEHPDDPVRAVHAAATAVPALRPDTTTAIERALADNVIGWHETTGHRIVYWGGLAHTTPRDVAGHPTLGALLRRAFPHGYAHVGLTLGAVEGGAVPRPETGHAEASLSAAGPPAYALDLRGDAPQLLRDWFGAPATVRFVGPRYDPDVRLEGGSLSQWFDVLVHVRDTAPAQLLDVTEAVTRRVRRP